MTKRKGLTLSEKCKIITQYDSYKPCNQRDAAQQLNISQYLLSNLLKEKDKYFSELSKLKIENLNTERKRIRKGKNIQIEEALLKWFIHVRQMNAPVSRAILMDKALFFAKELKIETFQPTDGWLTRWKIRNNIVYRKLHGEKQDADFSAANSWIDTVLPSILKDYKPEDIYNADETGLYFRAIPESSLVFKNVVTPGGKKQKDRITLLMVCNMTGTDKKDLLVIGKTKNPRCFRGLSIPLKYANNQNAWMTSQIFSDYISEWDISLSKTNRNIALILDNCSCHLKLVTKYIKLIFLPANTTSIIQPLDQGIIKSLKTHYRKDLRQIIINTIDEGKILNANEISKKITLLEAMHMLQKSWNLVSSLTIINCFKKAGFTKQFPDFPTECDVTETLEIDADLVNWISIDDNLPTSSSSIENDILESVREDYEKNETSESDDEIIQCKQPPSMKDINDALFILKRNLEFRSGTPEEFKRIYQVECDALSHKRQILIQATLDKYFNKD